MTKCEKINPKLSSKQLNKLQSTMQKTKNKTGATLRMPRKLFEGNILHEMLLTARQNTKLQVIN